MLGLADGREAACEHFEASGAAERFEMKYDVAVDEADGSGLAFRDVSWSLCGEGI